MNMGCLLFTKQQTFGYWFLKGEERSICYAALAARYRLL